MTLSHRSLPAALAILIALALATAGPVLAFDGEAALHEAAKKEKERAEGRAEAHRRIEVLQGAEGRGSRD